MELAQFYGTRAPPLYSIDIGSVLYTNMLHPSNYIMHFTFDFGTSLQHRSNPILVRYAYCSFLLFSLYSHKQISHHHIFGCGVLVLQKVSDKIGMVYNTVILS